MLAIPRYGKTTDLAVDFLCFIYKNEERVLSDIIYSFKEAREFPKNITKDLLAQVHFKAVLDMTILRQKDMD